jgi:hypothetical protein
MRSYRLSAPERAMFDTCCAALGQAAAACGTCHAQPPALLEGVGTLQLLPRTPSPRCPASFRLWLCLARNGATRALPGVRAAAVRTSHAKPTADGLSAWHRSPSVVACVPANTAGRLPLQCSCEECIAPPLGRRLVGQAGRLSSRAVGCKGRPRWRRLRQHGDPRRSSQPLHTCGALAADERQLARLLRGHGAPTPCAAGRTPAPRCRAHVGRLLAGFAEPLSSSRLRCCAPGRACSSAGPSLGLGPADAPAPMRAGGEARRVVERKRNPS